MATTDPQVVAWHVELRSSGRVCVDVSRGRSLVYLLVALLMTAVAGGLLATGRGAGIFWGAILAVVGVPMVVLSVQQVLRARLVALAARARRRGRSDGAPRLPARRLGRPVRRARLHAQAQPVGLAHHEPRVLRRLGPVAPPGPAADRPGGPAAGAGAASTCRRTSGSTPWLSPPGSTTRSGRDSYAELERLRGELGAAVQSTAREAERLAAEENAAQDLGQA